MIGSSGSRVNVRVPLVRLRPPSHMSAVRWTLSSALCLIFLSTLALAQSPISVPGITGLTLTPSDTSTTTTVTDAFFIHGMRIFPDSLVLKYDKPADRFVILGRAKVAFDDSSMHVTLGDSEHPGVVIDSGQLTAVHFAIARSFTCRSLTFIPDSLQFSWTSDTTFGVHGSLAVLVGSDTVNLSAGNIANPGMIFAGGKLKKIDLSVSATFSIKTLTCSPDSLGFSWLADSTFTMHGSLTALVSSDSVKLSAGTASQPGIVVAGGHLSKLELLASGKFAIKSLSLLPDSLGFSWIADSTFTMYGSLTALVSSDSVRLSAGSASHPGIVVAGGRLSRLELLANGKFAIKSLSLLPDSLGFAWLADSTFTMHGSLTALVSSDSVRLSAGTASHPGIVVAGGHLSKLELLASGKFAIKSLSLLPDSLGFSWIADSTFTMYGSLTALVSSDSVRLSAGTASHPGIVVAGGRLSRLELLANGKFAIKSLTLLPDSLGFSWLTDSTFTMHGSLTALVSNDSVRLSAGSVSQPGIVVAGGHLSRLELLANGKFAIKSLTLLPDSLGFSWLADSTFTMYGSLAVLVSADTVSVRAGTMTDPGIVFVGSHLSKLQLEATAKFSIRSLTLIPDSLGITWIADSGFSMHGSLSVLVGADTINVSAGTAAEPGVVFTGGGLSKLQLEAKGTFTIKTLRFIPDSLGFTWLADSSFAMHGSLSTIVSEDTISLSAGTVADPGILVVGGRLSKLQLEAKARFSIKTLTFMPDSLGFTWLADSSFAMHGSLTVIISADTVRLSAGTLAHPGVLVQGGRLTKLQFEATARFSVRSLTFIPDSLGFSWLADSTFTMHGALSVIMSTDTVRLSAGTAEHPGIVFTGGHLSKLQLLASAKFSIRSLTLIPDSLGFSWLADSTFTMHGSLSAIISSDTVRLWAGTSGDPGIVFLGGHLSKLELVASTRFAIKALTFIPDSLGFTWIADSSFAMHGSLSVIVAADTIKVSAGSAANPGMLIAGGRLTKLHLAVSARFTVKALTFIPDSLGFTWLADSLFAMHGSLAFLVSTDTVRVSAGTDADPGIVVAGGHLTKLHLTASAQFTFKGITVAPHGIGFSWISDSTNMFAMYGSVTVTVNGSPHSASFGTEGKPGFVIVNGAVTRWALSLTDTLKLTGVSIALTEASLAYDAQAHIFSIWGGATVSVGPDTVALSLGTETLPGLRIVDGRVTTVTAGVTASFKVGGLTLSPDHLTFSWDDSTHTVQLYGSLKSVFDGRETIFFAGTKEQPGIKIVNGAVKSLSLGVTADLRVSSLAIKPRGLSFVWADSGFFKLYGRATVGMAADTIEVLMGDSANPGMLIAGNSLEHFNVGVTADFHVSKLRIQPKALTFRYDKPTGAFSLFGAIVVYVATDTMAALLGDSTSPGLVYANGAIQHVNIGVTAGFGVKGLYIKARGLTLVWASDSNYFKLYGGAGITIGPDSIGCDFGTVQHPGLIVQNGELKYLSININSDLKIGNIEVKVQDLDIVYENARYLLKGSCSIKQVFALSVTLGSGTTPGIILDVSTPTPQFIVQNLLLEISHANFGAVDLKNFRLQITNGQIANSSVSIAFPGGWEVGAGIAFKGTPAQIDSIGIDWAATSMQSAIVMPNGMLLAGMRGSLKNLATPSQLSFAGEVLLLYGGPVSIPDPGTGVGREGALIYMKTFATISRAGMTIGADAKIGAYKVDSYWQSVLGEGTATLTVVWGQSAKLQGNFRIPSAPNQIVEIQPLVYFDARKNFDALLSVTFYAPGFLPIIGGWRIGDAAGAMRYRNGDLWHSYAAAWASGRAVFFDWTVGAEYNFGSRGISVLGDGEVSAIRREIEDDTRTSPAPDGRLAKAAGRPVRSLVHSFTTSSPAPSVLLVAIRWPSKVDSTVVTVLGPEGFYELTRLEEMKGDSLAAFLRSQKIESDFAVVSGDSIATFIVAPRAAFTYDSTVTALLPQGQYQVVCTSYDVTLDSVAIIVMPMYEPPRADIRLSDGPIVEVTYASVQTESTLVDVYVADAPSYSGRLVKHVAGNVVAEDGRAHVDTLFKYAIGDSWVGQGDSLWFYAVIEDGLNPPHLTPIVGPYHMPPAIRGHISFSEGIDTVTAGLLVFLDDNGDGNWDTPSTGEPEIHCVTVEGGTFRLPAVPEGVHSLRVLIPPGFTLLAGNVPVNNVPIDYRGMPMELNLQLRPAEGTTE